ncbi:MAG TPA: mycothiol synthase [Mycobacteriales bacterium]|jgi:mycothiol synthase|nr:mycothiol synthase [Mycobacteriales bacterium]
MPHTDQTAAHRVEARASALTSQELVDIVAIVTEATETDATPPLSDQTRLRIRHPGDAETGIHLLLRDGSAVVGYGYAGGGDGELVVHPRFRGHGRGRALLEAILANAPRVDGQLRLWAHGRHPSAVKLAERFGLTADRMLWRLQRPLADDDPALAEPQLSDDVRIRAFVPGQDEQPWLRLNSRAFAGHPEQGSWTLTDLRLRENEPWFDPAGFLLAERESTGELLGAHWTKIHQKSATSDRVGEVYVLSTDPDSHGLGLGGALLVAGLRYLREQGLDRVMLYTDAYNAAAVRLYRKWGFSHVGTDVQYVAVNREPT